MKLEKYVAYFLAFCMLVGGCARYTGIAGMEPGSYVPLQTTPAPYQISQPPIVAPPRRYSQSELFPANGSLYSLPDTLRPVAQAYREFRYEDVVRAAALVVWRDQEAAEVKAAVLIYAGASAYLLGSPYEAQDYFRDAYRLAPGIQPTANYFTEEIRELYRQSR